MKRTNVFGIAVMLLALLSFASCNKEKELTKMISADRVELTRNNSNLFEIDADSVMVKLIPVGVNGDEWEVRTILPMSNTTPWSKIPGSDQNQASFIYGVSLYPKYLDGNDSELDLSVEMDSQDLVSLLKSEEFITKEIPIKEYSYGNKSYKKQKAFITNASHELKTPLTIISTDLELVEMDNGKSEWTESIHDQVMRLNTMTKQLVTLSRLDEGNASNYPFAEFSLSKLASESVDSFAPTFKSKQLSFNSDNLFAISS